MNDSYKKIMDAALQATKMGIELRGIGETVPHGALDKNQGSVRLTHSPEILLDRNKR